MNKTKMVTKSYYIREDQDKWLQEVAKCSSKTMSKIVEMSIDIAKEIMEEHKDA